MCVGFIVISNLFLLVFFFKLRLDCLFNGFVVGDGFFFFLSDMMGDYFDGNGLFDFRDMGVLKVVFDLGLFDDLSE